MFVPHNGGGLVSVQFRSLVTNTATDQRPRALSSFSLHWSMTALLILFSSDFSCFFLRKPPCQRTFCDKLVVLQSGSVVCSMSCPT